MDSHLEDIEGIDLVEDSSIDTNKLLAELNLSDLDTSLQNESYGSEDVSQFLSSLESSSYGNLDEVLGDSVRRLGK